MEEKNTLRLKGKENWATWKFLITVLINSKGLEKVVFSNEKLSEKEILEKDAKAMALIVSRLDENILSHVLSCKTAAEVWAKLMSVFEQSSQVSEHILLQNFYSLTYKDSIATLMSEMENIRSKLRACNNELTDKMCITKILMTLPQEFRHFISAWESMAEEKQTFNELTSRLYIEELRNKEDESSSGVEALAANRHNIKCYRCGQPGHISRECKKGRSDSTGQKCHYCGKPGHKISDCWFRKRKEETSSDKNALVSMMPGEVIALTASSTEWILDSGASDHMCCDQDLFANLHTNQAAQMVKIGDGSALKVQGIGEVHVEAWDGSRWIETTLQEVLFVPQLKVNLFSVGRCLDKGLIMKTTDDHSIIINKQNKVKAMAKRCDKKLFKLLFRPISTKISTCNYTLREWHEIFCHQNLQHVKNYLNLHKIKFSSNSNNFCEGCLVGKQHRFSFGNSEHRSNTLGGLVHADLCGPMDKESIGGSRYFLLLKDDMSGYKFVYFLKFKSETKKYIEKFLNFMKTQTGNEVKILRTDNGLEFCNRNIESMLELRGIRHQRSVVYTPQQNGRAERENRTVVEAARTMMAQMSKRFWAEAVNTAVFTLNRCGPSPVKDKSPYEVFYGKSFDINFLKNFGQSCAVHVPKQKRKKLDSKTRFGTFIGYDDDVKGYRVYFGSTDSIEIARDVVFIPENGREKEKSHEKVYDCDLNDFEETCTNDLNVMNNDNKKRVNGDTNECENECPNEIQIESDKWEEAEANTEAIAQERDISPTELVESRVGNTEAVDQNYNLRERSDLKPPKRYQEDYYSYAYLLLDDGDEPQSYKEAIRGEDAQKWQTAVKMEIDALNENNTWTMIDDVGQDVIDTKWVFKKKRNKEGKVEVYKARLVARGFQQKGILFDEVYSPVTNLTTVRTLLAIAGHFSWKVHQMDISSAFLHSIINDDVYIKLPEGFRVEGKIGKLNKAIYGLKKAPRYWYDTFDSAMLKLGFKRSLADMCLYVKVEHNYKIYLIVFVDDILIISSDEKAVINLKGLLAENFKTKDLGLASHYLGMSITQSDDGIYLDQCNYLKKVLDLFNMSDCKSVSVPLDANFDSQTLLREKSENMDVENRCRRAIGCLMYAMIGTRPDLSIYLNILSRYQSCASEELWSCIKRVLRYVKGTVDLKLLYCKDSVDTVLKAYVDADWAGDTETRRSTSGFCTKVFGNLVQWCSKKQSCVSLSSTEAEYVALSQCIAQAQWLRNVFLELRLLPESDLKFKIYEDNQSAICAANRRGQPRRLKHIDLKYHFIQQAIHDNVIILEYIRTDQQLADMLTKPLPRNKLELLRSQIGLI